MGCCGVAFIFNIYCASEYKEKQATTATNWVVNYCTLSICFDKSAQSGPAEARRHSLQICSWMFRKFIVSLQMLRRKIAGIIYYNRIGTKVFMECFDFIGRSSC